MKSPPKSFNIEDPCGVTFALKRVPSHYNSGTAAYRRVRSIACEGVECTLKFTSRRAALLFQDICPEIPVKHLLEEGWRHPQCLIPQAGGRLHMDALLEELQEVGIRPSSESMSAVRQYISQVGAWEEEAIAARVRTGMRR